MSLTVFCAVAVWAHRMEVGRKQARCCVPFGSIRRYHVDCELCHIHPLIIITLLREVHVLPDHETLARGFLQIRLIALPYKPRTSQTQILLCSTFDLRDVRWVSSETEPVCCRSPHLFVTMLLLPLSQSAAGALRSSLFLLVSRGTSR